MRASFTDLVSSASFPQPLFTRPHLSLSTHKLLYRCLIDPESNTLLDIVTEQDYDTLLAYYGDEPAEPSLTSNAWGDRVHNDAGSSLVNLTPPSASCALAMAPLSHPGAADVSCNPSAATVPKIHAWLTSPLHQDEVSIAAAVVDQLSYPRTEDLIMGGDALHQIAAPPPTEGEGREAPVGRTTRKRGPHPLTDVGPPAEAKAPRGRDATMGRRGVVGTAAGASVQASILVAAAPPLSAVVDGVNVQAEPAEVAAVGPSCSSVIDLSRAMEPSSLDPQAKLAVTDGGERRVRVRPPIPVTARAAISDGATDMNKFRSSTYLVTIPQACLMYITQVCGVLFSS